MVVAKKLWVELVGLALQEPIVAIKSPLQRPVVEGTRYGRFVHGCEMPLSCSEGTVSLGAEDFR